MLTPAQADELIAQHLVCLPIESLPLVYREVVVLCELQELDYTSAAAIVECPLGTIRSRLHRARALLRSQPRRCSTSHVLVSPGALQRRMR